MDKQTQQIFGGSHSIVPLKKNLLNNISISIFLLCVMLVVFHSFKKHEYNWDMLPYMGVILSYNNSNINLVHDSIYNIIKKQVPFKDYNLLVDGSIEMRRHAAESASYFHEQLPFYVVKPLYTKLIYYFYKSGVPLIEATVLPSVISYFFIAVIILYWMNKYMHLFLALPVSLLVMLCRPLFSIARISTPDCLSALFLLSAFYCLIEKKNLIAICAFLILSIFVRIDNIIPAIVIILSIALTNKWKEKISLKKLSFILLAMCISYFLVTYNVREYGWNIFYYPSFLSHLNTTYSNTSFNFSNYFEVIRSQIMTGLFFSDLFLFLLLGLILFIGCSLSQLKALKFDQLLIIIILLIISIRFILQPIIADRFYVAYYITILVLVIRKISFGFNQFKMQHK